VSSHAIHGKPRGGKTYFSIKKSVEWLANDPRPIIGNAAWILPELNAYFLENHPEKQINVFEKLTILDDQQTRRFWTYRPYGVRIPCLTKEQWKEEKIPDYTSRNEKDKGVIYIIDEIHNYFNSRAWQETGRDVLFYMSQHGKLGDTVIWITQDLDNVDNQFKSVTQDFTEVLNLKKVRISKFKMPALFVWKTRTSDKESAAVVESGSFTLDPKIARCYDTSKGVGIMGNGIADKFEKLKGIPWWVGAVGLVALVAAAFTILPKLAFHFLGKTLAPATSAAKAVRSVSTNVVSITHTAPGVLAVVPQLATNEVFLVGRALIKRKIYVVLSDGRTFNLGDGHCTFVDRESVVIDGREYFYDCKPKPFVSYVAPLPSASPTIVEMGKDQETVGSSVVVIGHREGAPRMTVPGFNNNRTVFAQ